MAPWFLCSSVIHGMGLELHELSHFKIFYQQNKTVSQWSHETKLYMKNFPKPFKHHLFIVLSKYKHKFATFSSGCASFLGRHILRSYLNNSSPQSELLLSWTLVFIEDCNKMQQNQTISQKAKSVVSRIFIILLPFMSSISSTENHHHFPSIICTTLNTISGKHTIKFSTQTFWTFFKIHPFYRKHQHLSKPLKF